MGEINSSFTNKQRQIFDSVVKDHDLSSQFYFTGGTALSVYYYKHRESEDLDFFSEKKFDPDKLVAKVNKWSEKSFEFTYNPIEDTHIFNLTFKDKEKLKVDFNHFPFKRIKKGIKDGNMEIDSLFDIGANKMTTIVRRQEPKDFVDLYFLLKDFTVWDLMHAMRVKFGFQTDPFVLSQDFMKAENLNFLPKMILPLTLEELKSFYRKKAEELGKKSTV